MKFGVGIPTCTEGMMYPVPYATPEGLVKMCEAAEALGFDHVMGNDHVSTQSYVRKSFPDPPTFYEPMLAMAFAATRTSRLRLATGVIVLPLRHPVTLAKQAATFDHFSKGRLILGVGVGAYREEFLAMYGGGAGKMRGDMVTEHLEALQLLFTERRATYKGKYYQFSDVESYPKPLQNPLPVWVAGNAEAGVKRAARYGTGWLPAILSAKEIADRLAILRRTAEQAGRDPSTIEIAPQFAVAIGETAKEAEATFKRSQLYHHLESLRQSTLKEQTGSFDERSLMGTPEMICAQVDRFRKAGVTCCAGLFFIGSTVDENIAAMRLFAAKVMPNFQ